jgi:GNAT superfamily N-acetyltransferase
VATRRELVIRSGIVLTDRNGVRFPPIRRLGPEDLEDCAALSVDRGWPPEKSKWSLLLEQAEAFGVDAPDGGLAGSVVLARYGKDLASVGMMLVAARYGRRGLGRALMEHLLDAAAGATVTLFATDAGKPLYEKLGFRTIRRSAAFVGRFRAARAPASPPAPPPPPPPAPPPPPPPAPPPHDNSKMRSRPALAADMAAILDIDMAAFGADRGPILTRLPAFAEQLRVLEMEAGTAGYAAAWRNTTSTVIGPVVAANAAGAERLIADLAAQVRGPIRLDLDPDGPELPRWALAHGLEPVSLNAVMAYGDWNPRGNPDWLYAPISVALA